MIWVRIFLTLHSNRNSFYNNGKRCRILSSNVAKETIFVPRKAKEWDQIFLKKRLSRIGRNDFNDNNKLEDISNILKPKLLEQDINQMLFYVLYVIKYNGDYMIVFMTRIFKTLRLITMTIIILFFCILLSFCDLNKYELTLDQMLFSSCIRFRRL